METSSIILLVVSASISFGLGRTIVHFRNKKRKVRKDQLEKRQLQALREQSPEPESRNKSKRRRQLQQIDKSAGKL